jgi:hypothetical protein
VSAPQQHPKFDAARRFIEQREGVAFSLVLGIADLMQTIERQQEKLDEAERRKRDVLALQIAEYLYDVFGNESVIDGWRLDGPGAGHASAGMYSFWLVNSSIGMRLEIGVIAVAAVGEVVV